MKIKLGATVLLSWVLLGCGFRVLNGPKEAVYLIPKGYVGSVVILFDQADGVTPEIENGFKVYKIPDDGVLRVRAAAVYSIDELRVFYVDKAGSRTEVTLVYPSSQASEGDGKKTYKQIPPDDPTIYASVGDMGSFSVNQRVIRYRAFAVGPASESERLFEETRRKITGLQKKF